MRLCIIKMSQDKNFRPIEICPECGESSELALASSMACIRCDIRHAYVDALA